jgi:hypothetical protein
MNMNMLSQKSMAANPPPPHKKKEALISKDTTEHDFD